MSATASAGGDRGSGGDPHLPGPWLVEVWLHEDVFASGSVVDVGPQDLWVKTSETAGNVMRQGELCRLKIHSDEGVVVCTGEIRSIDQHGIRFEVREGLSSLRVSPNGTPNRLSPA